jgi:hypothetical protein
MGVQVRIATARRLVLVRDRHQAGQALQVSVAGGAVVDPGVAGVLMQVLHRGLYCSGVGGGEDFFGDVVGERADEGNTLGRSESQVETVHALVGELASLGAVGCLAVVEPDSCVFGVGVAAVERGIGEARRLADELFIADDEPSGDTGFAFRVVLRQSAVGHLTVHGSLFGFVGGVVVVLDAVFG